MTAPRLDDLPSPPAGREGWPWTADGGHAPAAPTTPRPRLSIVTPSYNHGRYLEETIRSVLLQGVPGLEYIVMDGGSTDDSVDIIRRYQPWLAHWTSGPDGGQTRAINEGWRRGSGDLVAYINADDLYLPGAAAAAADAFAGRPEAGMVYGTAAIVDEAGQPVRAWAAAAFTLRAMVEEGNVVPQPAAFFSRRALESVGLLDERWDMIMDYALAVRLGLAFPSVCLPATLARFREHRENKSQVGFERLAGELLAFLDELETDALPANELERLRRTGRSRVHYEWALALVARNERPAFAARRLAASLRIEPRFALRRPAQTAFLVKEIVRAAAARRPVRRGSTGRGTTG